MRQVGKLLLVEEQIGMGRPGVLQQTMVGVQTSWQEDKNQNWLWKRMLITKKIAWQREIGPKKRVNQLGVWLFKPWMKYRTGTWHMGRLLVRSEGFGWDQPCQACFKSELLSCGFMEVPELLKLS